MKGLDRIAEQLRRQLPDGVRVEVGGNDNAGELHEEEAAATAGWAPQRRKQFAIGRTLARRALERLGHISVPILYGSDGEPLWPSGWVGSISHKRNCCIVLVGSASRLRSIGVDLEHDRLDPAETDILQRVCPEQTEQRQAVALGASTASPGTLFLAAKEAFYKCQYPLTQTRLDWDDVLVSFTPPVSFTAAARHASGKTIAHGTYLIMGGWIVAAVVEIQRPVAEIPNV